jgi:medium-chain acyl-[acyl-carrier-protein] hydrolase
MGTTPPVWKEQRVVESHEIDMFGVLRPHMLFGTLLNSAWNLARGTSFGYQALTEKNLMWVLSKLRLEIPRPPAWGEQISIETWGKRIDRFYALRDFAVSSPEGEKLASATSAWMILNKESYRPQKLEVIMEGFPWQPGKVELETSLKKVPEIEGGTDRAQFDVHFSDIDVNSHANATKYLQWLLDSYPLEHHAKRRLKSVEISFVAEAVMGDHVTVRGESLPDCDRLAIRRGPDGKELCRASIGWGSREETSG